MLPLVYEVEYLDEDVGTFLRTNGPPGILHSSQDTEVNWNLYLIPCLSCQICSTWWCYTGAKQ